MLVEPLRGVCAVFPTDTVAPATGWVRASKKSLDGPPGTDESMPVMFPEPAASRGYFQISFIGATALALPTCPVSAMPSSMVRSTL
jgi:hypothetical protein